MNQLTKLLVGELLENKQVIGLYGGGFKPPTKGHFEVVEQALKEYPELDKLIIYVGGGVRDGITQEQSLAVWDIYKDLLGDKVEIQPSPSPIGDIIRYGRDNADKIVYFFLGEREGKESDVADTAQRTKNVEVKYPNTQIKIIKSPDTGISGTAARKILLNPEKTFEDFKQSLPDGLADGEKQQIYDLLKKGAVKEGDPKTGTGKKPEGSGRRLYTDEDPTDTVSVKFSTKQDIIDTLSKASFKAKSHARQSQIINLIHQRVRAAYERAKDPEVKSRLKTALDYAEQRKEASKAKTQRLNKENVAPNHTGKSSPYGSGYAPVKESYQFKVSDKNYDEEDNSLISVDYKFSTPDNDYRVEFYSGEYSPKSKTFDVSFGVDKYGSKIDTFQMTGEGNALSILKTIVNIIKDFTKRFEVNKLVINPTSEKHKKIYSMMLKLLPSDILSKVELIKENQEQDWNLQDAFVSLSKFMIDKGMSIQPLPKIQFIDNDEGNAQNILGNTAYYNPQSKAIVLYTLNRHPKDILRSFCHEMVHHEQNMKGTLGDIRTQNTTEDSHLDRIEREAYEKGNIMFRNWEDNYKKTWQSENPSVPSNPGVNEIERGGENKGGEGNPGGDKYTIYCDMDGVLCDFDKRFMEFSNGIPPPQYENEFGKKAFWELISKKGVGFWVGIPWMPDGKQLWNYIKPHNPSLLSAPSREESSRLGKRLWVRNNIPGTKLILRQAEQKQEFANPNAILIDDRTSNIQQWRDKGGIGIMHTSANETIKQLKELGL
jgi:hypothetical protein